MAGSREKKTISEFYCINCGNRGIPVWRKRGRLREPLHRKVLYCTTCKQTVNHVEIRTEEERMRFMTDFAEGKYRDEAERSVAYGKETET